MVIVLGHVVARADTFAEVLALSQAHVARSRTEPGCISHAVHQDTEHPRRLVFVEQWADRAALATHFQLRESRAFVKALSALLEEAPRIVVYDATPLSM